MATEHEYYPWSKSWSGRSYGKERPWRRQKSPKRWIVCDCGDYWKEAKRVNDKHVCRHCGTSLAEKRHSLDHTTDVENFEGKEREERLRALHDRLREKGLQEEASLLLEELPARSVAKPAEADIRARRVDENKPLWR